MKPHPLPPRHAIERALKGGETHSYQIELKAGEFAHIEVGRRSLDVQLDLIDAGGKVNAQRDRPNGTQSKEVLSFMTPTAGEYTVQVKALDEKSEAGMYEITSEAPRSPTAIGQRRIEAETLFQEGSKLSRVRTAEFLQQSCEKFAAVL